MSTALAALRPIEAFDMPETFHSNETLAREQICRNPQDGCALANPIVGLANSMGLAEPVVGPAASGRTLRLY
jgi:hypothetical protein